MPFWGFGNLVICEKDCLTYFMVTLEVVIFFIVTYQEPWLFPELVVSQFFWLQYIVTDNHLEHILEKIFFS